MAVAVVTGASRGLGQALVQELSSRGFAVAGCSRRGSAADVEAVDVGGAVEVERFATRVHDQLGPIDLWINNAGVVGPIGPLRSSSAVGWVAAVETNLLGTVNGCRAFLAHHASRGTLVNLASRAGVSAAPGLAAYSATKAAVIALTLAVAAEESDAGLRTVVVIPPSIGTDMQEELLGQEPGVFPGVIESRGRRERGEIVTPALAAARIITAVLDERHDGVVLDLT